MNIKRISESLEAIVRHIYNLTVTVEMPTIIILEVGGHVTPIQLNYTNHHHNENYLPIAKHYNIPIWSFRDAVYSTILHTKQLKYQNYLNLGNNYLGGTHPPWHVHLFMADLFAAIMVREFATTCNTGVVGTGAVAGTDATGAVTATNRHKTPLPPRLMNNTEVRQCDAQYAPHLSISYDKLNRNETVIGTYQSTPADAWQVGLQLTVCLYVCICVEII